MPHPVAVDQPAARRVGDLQHAPVDVRGNAGKQVAWRLTEPRRPVAAHQFVVAADAARGDHDCLCGKGELAGCGPRTRRAAPGIAGFEQGAVYAGDRAVGHDEVIDAVPERESHLSLSGRGAHPPLEGFDDSGSGAPGDVEARDRVAVAVGEVAAAFGPADDREEAHALGVQPGALLGGGEIHVSLGPAPRPVVLFAVEAGAAQPVLPGQLVGVADAHPALFRGIDEEQSAEGPERLAAERGLRFLLDEDHPPSGVGQFGGRHQPGKPASDHDDIRVHDDRTSSLRVVSTGLFAGSQADRRPRRDHSSTKHTNVWGGCTLSRPLEVRCRCARRFGAAVLCLTHCEHDRGAAVIEELLPPGAIAVETRTDPPDAVLFPEEQAELALAVEKRRLEFTTVRHCARSALARLGVAPVAILPGPRGAPQWPTGIVGSMTHCAGYRAAVVARSEELATIGVDAEPHEALPPEVLTTVTIPEERERLERLAAQQPAVHWD